MHVDRARFIALTLTLAAGGCGAEPARGVAGRDAPAPVPIPPVRSESVPAAEPPPRGSEHDGGTGAPTAGSASATAHAAEPPEDYSYLPPGEQELMRRLKQLTRQNTGCGPIRPPHPPPPPGWMAEEPPPRPLVGQAKRCRQIQQPWQLPGPHCEDWSLGCEEAISVLKPPAGRRAIECLRRKSGTRGICGFNTVTHCVIGAVRATRPSAPVDAVCRQVMRLCQGKTPKRGAARLTLQDCRHYLGSVDCPETEQAGSRLTYECALGPSINPLW